MMMAIVVVVDSRESREDMESHERGFKALLLLSVFVLFVSCFEAMPTSSRLYLNPSTKYL